MKRDIEPKGRIFSFSFLFYDILKNAAYAIAIPKFRVKRIYENSEARRRIKGGALVISNHIGYYDPIYMWYAIPYRRQHCICLDMFFDKPLKAWFFRHALCIPIDRDNFSMESFRSIVGHLEKDEMVCLFPSGHISSQEDSASEAFKSGMVMMAHMSGKPIIPLYFEKPKTFFHRLKVVIGEGISVPKRMSLAEMDSITKSIQEKEIKLKKLMEMNNGIQNKR